MGRVASTLLALIVLIAPSCGSRRRNAVPQPPSVSKDMQSNLTMRGMHIQSFSDAKIAWDVKAPLGEMFTRGNTMRLHEMHATFYDNGQPSGQITAARALLATGASPAPLDGVTLGVSGDAYLSKDVVMTSTDGTKVYTDWARYSKQDDLITSTAPVRVVRNDSVTNGIGMEARPDMSDLKIFQQTLLIPGTDENSETTE